MTYFTLHSAKKLAFLGVLTLITGFVALDSAQAAVLAMDTTTPQTTLKSTFSTVEPLHEDGTTVIQPKPDKVSAAVMTAYSSTPDQTDSDPFTAASGKRVYYGMIANNCYPFGTQLRFLDKDGNSAFGDKVFTVDDRMNSRYGCNRFDMWLDEPLPTVRAFGVKRLSVEIFYKKKVVKKVVELAQR